MKNLLVITDPGLDPDDIVNAWLLATAHQRGEINLLGAIANYSPSIMRARLLKGVFNSLSAYVKVRVGTDCNSQHEPRDYEFDFPLAEVSEVFGHEYWESHSGIRRILESAEDESVTLQLISGLTDIAQAISDYPQLLKQKVKEVYIMGGASFDGKFLVADPTASNNKFDKTLDSQVVYDFFIEAQIPLKVLTRFAAYGASVNPIFYDRLKGINEVGSYLYRVQRKSIEALWANVNNNPPEHRLNREWFFKTFCSVDSLGRFEHSDLDASESPWEYVERLALYDPLTSLYMLHPELFFKRWQLIKGVKHEIVGLNQHDNGLYPGSNILIHNKLKEYLV